MVLKLYGNRISPNTNRIALVLREKKIPFEYVEVDMAKGAHKSPDHLARNPFGQVPAIDDDGFILYESRAIARYLVAKYPKQGSKLIPVGLKENAVFEQAASVEVGSFEPFVFQAVMEKIFKPMFGAPTDQSAYDDSIAKLTNTLNVYDKILAKQKYIAGDEFTLVDIFHLSFGDLLPKAGSDLLFDESRPNVARWWKDISVRENWIAVKDGVFESNA